jgi:hypothetical protein
LGPVVLPWGPSSRRVSRMLFLSIGAEPDLADFFEEMGSE